jgi:hypothetical protein
MPYKRVASVSRRVLAPTLLSPPLSTDATCAKTQSGWGRGSKFRDKGAGSPAPLYIRPATPLWIVEWQGVMRISLWPEMSFGVDHVFFRRDMKFEVSGIFFETYDNKMVKVTRRGLGGARRRTPRLFRKESLRHAPTRRSRNRRRHRAPTLRRTIG